MKVAIIGYGKMGHTIEKILQERGHEVVARVKSEGINREELRKADVAIEFSRPEAVVKNLGTCFEEKVPVVCGTTGWLAYYDEVTRLCRENDCGFIYASNFSLGVNLFFQLNQQLAAMMKKFGQYDVSLEEIHHRQKLDSPSGTAITLAEQVIENLDRKSGWTENENHQSDQIHIEAKREPEVPGTHVVKYTSEIDDIEIKHTAHNRKGFALGAVVAAEFLNGKSGIYTMKDVLNL